MFGGVLYGLATTRPERRLANVLDPGTHSRVDTCLVTNVRGPKRTLRSGELSRAVGVSADTLRHYERLGILKKPPRTQGGYRVHPPESLDRVLLIRNALASGFTLKELASILRVRDAGVAPCRQVAELAHEKVERLGARIVELTRLRNSLMRTAREWDRRLGRTSPGGRANLLESLSAEKRKQADNPRGDGNEDTATSRVVGDPGFGQRSKRNHVPHGRTSAGD